MREKYPNEKELEVLDLFYNRFYDLFDEIINDNFKKEDAQLRLFKLKEAFSIYKELLSYDPIKWVIEGMKNGGRPPLEGVIADDLFSFIRNLFSHFPVFKTWDEVFINKDLATWSKTGQIDRFLNKSIQFNEEGKGEVKYRIFDNKKKKMSYFTIKFPDKYDSQNIYLKDIVSEETGMKFCMILMKKILDTQIELEQ